MDTRIKDHKINHSEILSWLREDDPVKLEELWSMADQMRVERVGDEVHLRGLIEFSNHCVRRCAYCGISAGTPDVIRYRMDADEIFECVQQAEDFGYGTVVLQSGEDLRIGRDWVVDLITRIKNTSNLAITLSLGERDFEDYKAWHEAGADRYLLRFETSDQELFNRIHPGFPGRKPRIEILRYLRELGYEAGSGVMIGIPGQTYETLANDLETFRELDLDMIGMGPFIPHPQTSLGQDGNPDFPVAKSGEQVEANEQMTYKMIALTRLVRPDANIPSTTALATINLKNGRELGLCRGANIMMPNMTPSKYRELYEIYPDKACMTETSGQCNLCMGGRIHSIGRIPGKGQGGRGSNHKDVLS
jgi:biotin synthase